MSVTKWCEICGKEFKASTPQEHCGSRECKEELYRRTIENQKRAKNKKPPPLRKGTKKTYYCQFVGYDGKACGKKCTPPNRVWCNECREIVAKYDVDGVFVGGGL